MERTDNISPGLPLLALSRQLVTLPPRTVSASGSALTVACVPDNNRVSVLILWPTLNTQMYVRFDSEDELTGISGLPGSGHTLIHTSMYPVLTQQQIYVGNTVTSTCVVIETVYRPTN